MRDIFTNEKITQSNDDEEKLITSDEFIKHIEHASKVVSTWPVWKQELLGGTASKPTEE